MAHFELGLDENQVPTINECQKHNFWEYMGTKESYTLYRSIYDNVDGMQDKLLAFQARIAKKFMPNPYVMGFDPYNEPAQSQDNLLDRASYAI